MEESIDIKGYWEVFLRRWWVFVLCIGLALAAAWAFEYFTSRSDVPTYKATAKLLVQGGSEAIRSGDVTTDQVLAQYYDDLVQTRPFLDHVNDQLPSGPGAEALANKISIIRPKTLIEINATDTDPVEAALIANTTAATLIDDLRDRQLNQIARDQAALSQYGIAPDPSITATRLGQLTILSVAESAVPPRKPTSTGANWVSILILAGALGLLAALALTYLLERMDDRIKTPEDLKRVTGLSTLATVVRQPEGRMEDLLPAAGQENGRDFSFEESYKFLVTNLEFAALGMKRFKRLLVTSSTPLEGKTVTSSRLAVTYARRGESVILVDADLRRPSIHRIFNLENKKGLTDVVIQNASLEEALVQTPVEGLRILTSGRLPPDPTRLLQPTVIGDTLNALDAQADLIIFDSPPVLTVADTLAIASLVDGVILIVDSSETSEAAVSRSVESLKQSSAPLLGGVLNKLVPRGRGSYYYYYYNYSYRYREDGSRSTTNGGPGLLSRIFRRSYNGRQTVESKTKS